MYQRSYSEGYSVPENYQGIAAAECISEPCQEHEEVVHEPLHSEPFYECECECASAPVCEKKSSPTGERLKSLLKKLPVHLPRFEGDDFLLIGAAILLFFSKSGDKQCALILLALLFIG